MPSPRSLQILFIFVSTFIFFIVPEWLNNSWWCFSSSFSSFEDQRRISLESCPFFQRCVVLALCHPHNCFWLWQFFSYPSGAFHELFPFLSSEGHHFIILHSQHVTIVLQILRCMFKYSLISSWSIRSLVSKFSQASSFIFQFFLVVRSGFFVRSFNSYGGSFNIPLLIFSY